MSNQFEEVREDIEEMNKKQMNAYELAIHTMEQNYKREKFIVKITPIHETKSAVQNGFDITTYYDDYDVYRQFEKPLLDEGWQVIVFVPSKEEDSDRITCGNALISNQ